MGRKGQLDCQLSQILDPFIGLINYVLDLILSIIGGNCNSLGFGAGGCLGLSPSFGPLNVGIPIGPIMVVAVVLFAVATNTVNFVFSPLVIATAGVTCIGALVKKIK